MPAVGVCSLCGCTGHLSHSRPHVEYDYGQMWMMESQAHKQTLTKLTIYIWINGTEMKGLVDSGCDQNLIWDDLVSLRAMRFGTIFLQCIHGNFKCYPSAHMQLTANMKSLIMELPQMLAYTIILRWDWEHFSEVLGKFKPSEG